MDHRHRHRVAFRGLSRRLLTQLIDIARASGLKTLSADILTVNHPMLALSSALGFELDDPLGDGGVARATLHLNGSHDARVASAGTATWKGS
ncbi:MAG: N-acetyltransferase family protein [Burkholderiales bacterium]